MEAHPHRDEVGHFDPLEAALADALRTATAAGQWGVVAELAAELKARREAAQVPRCPHCGLQLAEYAGAEGRGWTCVRCDGGAP